MRLIDADALKRRIIHKLVISDATYLLPGEKAIYEEIEKMPSIDAPKGRWINVDGTEKYGCSECEIIMWFSRRLGIKPRDYKFCPNCGARMTGEEDE